MKTEEIFGNTDSIDVISQRGDIIELTLICNGYVEGSEENLKALLEKVSHYISWTESREFQRLYGEEYRVITVTFTEKPDESIIELLYGCRREALFAGVLLRVTIGGLPLVFGE